MANVSPVLTLQCSWICQILFLSSGRSILQSRKQERWFPVRNWPGFSAFFWGWRGSSSESGLEKNKKSDWQNFQSLNFSFNVLPFQSLSVGCCPEGLQRNIPCECLTAHLTRYSTKNCECVDFWASTLWFKVSLKCLKLFTSSIKAETLFHQNNSSVSFWNENELIY